MQGRELVTVLPSHQCVIWNNHRGYLTLMESLSSQGKGTANLTEHGHFTLGNMCDPLK